MWKKPKIGKWKIIRVCPSGRGIVLRIVYMRLSPRLWDPLPYISSPTGRDQGLRPISTLMQACGFFYGLPLFFGIYGVFPCSFHTGEYPLDVIESVFVVCENVFHRVFHYFFLLSIPQECFVRSSCMSVCLSVRPSVCIHHNSRTIRRRMMKLCTYVLEVKSNMELEDGSRA